MLKIKIHRGFRPLGGDLSSIQAKNLIRLISTFFRPLLTGDRVHTLITSVSSSGTYLPFPVVAIVDFSYSFDTICVGKEDKFHFYGHSPIKTRSICGISVCAGNIKKSAIRTFQIGTVFPHISYILTYEVKHPAAHP